MCLKRPNVFKYLERTVVGANHFYIVSFVQKRDNHLYLIGWFCSLFGPIRFIVGILAGIMSRSVIKMDSQFQVFFIWAYKTHHLFRNSPFCKLFLFLVCILLIHSRMFIQWRITDTCFEPDNLRWFWNVLLKVQVNFIKNHYFILY